jgi:hypothetical protein
MMERSIAIVFGALVIAYFGPVRAEDAGAVALRRAAVEANCPKVDTRQSAVRATTCRMKAMRPVLAEHAPAALSAFDKMAAGDLASAKKYEAGQITGEQYMAEAKARSAEFSAETEQGRQAWEPGTAARTVQSHHECNVQPLHHARLGGCCAGEASQPRMPALGPA